MSNTPSGRSFKDMVAEEGQTFSDAAEAYRFLTGKSVTPRETSDALRYERLRLRMVSARKRASQSQGSVASAMGTSQSEISRLENSLGPGTRLGTLLGYLGACRTSPEALFAEDDHVVPSRQDMRLVIEGKEFAGVEAVGILESVHAINTLLRSSEMSRAQHKDFILGFLAELGKVRERASAMHNVDVEIETPGGTHEPTIDISTMPSSSEAGALSERRFLDATRLSLIDF